MFFLPIIKADNIIFDVGFECEVCYPVEGMNFKCIVNNITKAGLRCEIPNERPSPLVIFVTRDHHFMKDGFSEINEGDREDNITIDSDDLSEKSLTDNTFNESGRK